MVTGYQEDTWGYDAALGYEDERRREETRGWSATVSEPPATWTWDDDLGVPVPSSPPPASSPHASSWSSASSAPPGSSAPTAGADPSGGPRVHPARLVLGMATLAADRLRGGPPTELAGRALETGVGLMQETAAGARGFARRLIEPASRLASDAMGHAALLPGAQRPLQTLARSRARFSAVLARARTRGKATVAAGRADAEAIVRTGVADTLSWAQAQAVPQLVDGLVPHLVDEVVPRILEGTLPEIRTRVLPAVIDDLTSSPQVRELVLEQGRGVVSEAAQNLRTTTASADDRVESAFRRLVRAPAPDNPPESPSTGG